MKRLNVPTLVIVLFGLTTLMAPLAGYAQLRSKSGEILVMEPRSFPEEAQAGGNSFFLHSDDSGNTYLYVEQQQGARLAAFDVSDPGRIKTVVSVPLTVSGPFDFVRPLDGKAELIRFRDGTSVGVLDLAKVKKPAIHIVSALVDPGPTEPLGETGFLEVNEPYSYVRAVPRDYQVVDISTPADPTLLTTVKLVKHRVVNGDTGTTFLLGSEGLTIVRRISVEKDYKTH